jgi:hypothetical protein
LSELTLRPELPAQQLTLSQIPFLTVVSGEGPDADGAAACRDSL